MAYFLVLMHVSQRFSFILTCIAMYSKRVQRRKTVKSCVLQVVEKKHVFFLDNHVLNYGMNYNIRILRLHFC